MLWGGGRPGSGRFKNQAPWNQQLADARRPDPGRPAARGIPDVGAGVRPCLVGSRAQRAPRRERSLPLPPLPPAASTIMDWGRGNHEPPIFSRSRVAGNGRRTRRYGAADRAAGGTPCRRAAAESTAECHLDSGRSVPRPGLGIERRPQCAHAESRPRRPSTA